MFDWLRYIADWFVYDILGLSIKSHLAAALNFFIYDSVKILLLLFFIIFLMGIINSYFPIDRVRNYLSRRKLYGLEYLTASLFGVVTPFCSCSSVPLFIGFVKGGIPLGVTFSFLVTSPLVNEVAIGLFLGLFGIKITLIYVVSGVLLGTVSGVIMQKLNLNYLLTDWTKEILNQSQREVDNFVDKQSFSNRLPSIWQDAINIIKANFFIR